jgi:rhamnosyl/mannosyltransferase
MSDSPDRGRWTMPNASPAPIRPLHVGKFLPPPFGGMESHVDALLTAIAPQATSTLLASVRGTVPPPSFGYRTIAARTWGVAASTAMSPQLPLLARRELASRRCNLLHVHAPNPWGDLSAIAAPRDIPVVMTWHSDIVKQKTLLRAYGPIQQAALRRADRVLVFTPKHYESSEQLHRTDLSAKIRVVPVGIDFARLDDGMDAARLPEELERWIAGRRVVLSVGRQVYYKGLAYLIDAFASVPREACLLLVGSGPLADALRQQCAARGLDDRVRFLGNVPHGGLQALLRASHVFCLPSIERSEAFGIATAEAMACGLPAVVCELGNGVNYLNRNGVTGLTVPVRDVPALAAALTQLVRDEPARRRLGEAARQWVRGEFSIEAMKAHTLAVYRELLGLD